MNNPITAPIKKLHQESIIIDGHCDTLLGLKEGLFKFGERYNPTPEEMIKHEHPGHIDLPRMKEGGITCQCFACFVRERYLPAGATHEVLRMIDAFYRSAEDNKDSFMQVKCAADIEKAKREGKAGGMITLEGAESLEGDLSVLRMLYRLGVRQIGLTWNWRNQVADGLYEERSGGGLTSFGVEFVKECNRLGIILDVAHLSPAGIRDVLALTEQPIVDSHCGARAVTEHVRNLSDEQLDQVAKNGGVVCITYVPYFINADPKQATLTDFIRHVDYVVKRIGAEHVGLGSDFDGYEIPLGGLKDISELANVTAALAEIGYSPEDIRKVMGENYLNLIRKVVG